MIIEASPKKPVIVCETCLRSKDEEARERAVHMNYTKIYVDPALRDEKRKTWRQLIRPDEHKTTSFKGRLVKVKVLYYTPGLDSCMKKRHKVTLYRNTFARTGVFNRRHRMISLKAK